MTDLENRHFRLCGAAWRRQGQEGEDISGSLLRSGEFKAFVGPLLAPQDGVLVFDYAVDAPWQGDAMGRRRPGYGQATLDR